MTQTKARLLRLAGLAVLACLWQGGVDLQAAQVRPGASASSSTGGQKTILILHSYHPGYGWTDDLDRGLRAALADSPYDLEIRVEYLDAKRYDGPAYFENLAAHYERKYTDLTFDVVMPVMGGRLLAERLAHLYPDVRVLFMSGYADDTIAGPDLLGSGAFLVEKPFGTADLSRRVRETLDDPARPWPAR